MTSLTLALDASAKPIGLVSPKQVVAQIAAEYNSLKKSVIPFVEDQTRRFRSQHLDLAFPLIVLYPYHYVQISDNKKHTVSRRVLFARDNYSCQYCDYQATPGAASKELTLDHVKPAHLFESRGQATTWENVTTACFKCNQLKGGFLPRECGMMPRNTPGVPNYVQLQFAGRVNSVQRDYIADYYGGKNAV